MFFVATALVEPPAFLHLFLRFKFKCFKILWFLFVLRILCNVALFVEGVLAMYHLSLCQSVDVGFEHKYKE